MWTVTVGIICGLIGFWLRQPKIKQEPKPVELPKPKPKMIGYRDSCKPEEEEKPPLFGFEIEEAKVADAVAGVLGTRKILKAPPPLPVRWKQKCEECHCVFSYTRVDVVKIRLDIEEVHCPNCNKEMFHFNQYNKMKEDET